MKFLALLLLSFVYLSAQTQWVDPHDMDTAVKQKIKNVSKVTPSSCNLESLNPNKESELYFRRIIRLLLDNAEFDKANTVEFHNGHINIQLNERDYIFLVEFAKNDKPNKNDFAEVQSILETAVQKSFSDRYTDYIISFQNQIYYMLFNKTTAILACSLFFLYICFKLVRAQFTWWEILKYFAFLIYVLDCVVTYLYLYEVEEIENMVLMKTHGTVPPECDPKKMNWLTYVKFVYETKFSESDCKVYYRASYQNLNYLVTPLKVFNHQLGVFIVQPLTHFGKGLGNFAASLHSSLPFPFSIIIFPIMLIVALILVTIILIFITKSCLKINLFHMINFEVGSSRPNQRDAIQNTRGFHRRFVENVPQNNSQSVSTNTTNAVKRSKDNRISNSTELTKTKNIWSKIKPKKKVPKDLECRVQNVADADNLGDARNIKSNDQRISKHKKTDENVIKLDSPNQTLE